MTLRHIAFTATVRRLASRGVIAIGLLGDEAARGRR